MFQNIYIKHHHSDCPSVALQGNARSVFNDIMLWGVVPIIRTHQSYKLYVLM